MNDENQNEANDSLNINNLFEDAFEKIDKIKENNTTEGTPVKEAISLPEETEVIKEEPIKEQIFIEDNEKLTKSQLKERRLRDEKRAKYQLAQENIELKKALAAASEAGMQHYTNGILKELEEAKAAKKYAFSVGDTDSAIEADLKLNDVIYRVRELEKWEQQKVNSFVEPTVIPSYEQKYEEEIVNEWIEDKPFLINGSKQFNEELANKVVAFTTKLDKYLVNTNKQNEYLSPAYFNTLDNYINKLTKESKSKEHAPIGGVRNGYSSNRVANYTKPNDTGLSDLAKEMAKNMGFTEAEWLEQKMIDAKKGR